MNLESTLIVHIYISGVGQLHLGKLAAYPYQFFVFLPIRFEVKIYAQDRLPLA
jgi:hypothetical protein